MSKKILPLKHSGGKDIWFEFAWEGGYSKDIRRKTNTGTLKLFVHLGLVYVYELCKFEIIIGNLLCRLSETSTIWEWIRTIIVFKSSATSSHEYVVKNWQLSRHWKNHSFSLFSEMWIGSQWSKDHFWMHCSLWQYICDQPDLVTIRWWENLSQTAATVIRKIEDMVDLVLVILPKFVLAGRCNYIIAGVLLLARLPLIVVEGWYAGVKVSTWLDRAGFGFQDFFFLPWWSLCPKVVPAINIHAYSTNHTIERAWIGRGSNTSNSIEEKCDFL